MTPAERLRALHLPPPPPAWAKARERLAIPALAVLTALAAAVLVPVPFGLLIAPVTAYAVHRRGRRLESGAVRRERRRAAADMPFALDVLAACLAAGAPVASAVRVVATALPGPLGTRLDTVATSLHSGADAAWSPLAELPGGERVIAATARSSGSGAALARGFERLAEELREAESLAAEAHAERASVLVVMPLGLCFLPAFVLMGLVPVVAAVLGDALPV